MVRTVVIVCVIIAILDYLLLFAIYEGDNKYGLFVFAPARHIHCRCDNRKVEYEDMKMTLILPDSTRHLNVIATTTFFEQKAVAVEPTEGSILDLMTFNYYPAEDGTTPLSTFGGSEDIQHVGYDEEQCGRTK